MTTTYCEIHKRRVPIVDEYRDTDAFGRDIYVANLECGHDQAVNL